MKPGTINLLIAAAFAALAASAIAQETHLVFEGDEGPGAGMHVVLISGDEEYRSEESCPMLGKILSQHHGFKCTVLFAIDPDTGIINPEIQTNIPGLEALKTADVMILATRFRNLPDAQLQPILDYVNAGKPIIGLRTATHAFNTGSKLGGLDWNNFGLDILGEKWAGHHGKHKSQGARGVIVEANAKHPILNGVDDIFAPSDVYGVKNLDESEATILVRAAVTETLDPDSKIISGEKNNPAQAAIWLREYTAPSGKMGTALTSTMGASVDFKSAGLRRVVVNGVFHLAGLKVLPKANVNPVDRFQPTFFSVNSKEYYDEIKLTPASFDLGKSTATGLASTRKPVTPKDQKKKNGGPDIPRPTYEQPKKASASPAPVELPITPAKGEHLVFIGNSLGERMLHHGFFETRLQERFPDSRITFRNMCHPADTPGFRAHPARESQWAFPGAERFHPDKQTHYGIGHYPYPDEWLTILEADTIVAFFGFNESFAGMEGLENFKAELSAFVDHTLSLAYNGERAPRLVLATPIAFEDRTADYDLPDGTEENRVLAAYAKAVLDVAAAKKVGAIDLFTPTKSWFSEDSSLTLNGCHLNERGYEKLAPLLAGSLFGPGKPGKADAALLREAILDKDWLWMNDYRMLNGVHVWGQRWTPYGNVNYPEEIEKIREMTGLRDEAIWKIARGETDRFAVDDSATRALSKIETNYDRPIEYLSTVQAKSRFQLPEGFEIELFASEKEFPLLQNPCQMAFDNRGRLWVTTVPSYPHYKPGAARPDDKILILEDTDGDHRADKQTVFADKLHIPIGFELAPEGVYVSQEPYLMLLKDNDGDDVADERIRIMDGFDSHDTHHAISAYCADASGAFYLCEGRFLHSQVETPYGPQRMTDGGLWRFDPRSWRLTRHSQSDYSNPWAVAFDEFGQDFLGDASGGDNWWLLALGAKVPHGYEIGKTAQFTTQKVRPTSGGEFIASRHFPDEYQGDYLLCNTIGFLGVKQHTIVEDGSGFTGRHRQDLVRSDDGNFRPCDIEFAPDGSLYIVDWHNALIGHMQHSARDPNRNSQYGRIYRLTYPSRPLVEEPAVDGASVAALLENLKLHEYRARYRSRRELREHPASEVIPAVRKWAAGLDEGDPNYGRHLLEALWATWAQGRVDRDLLVRCLEDGRHHVRAGAVRVLRYTHAKIENSTGLFMKAAADSHPRVRLEALVAASWMENADGAKILFEAVKQPFDKWMGPSIEAAFLTLKPYADGIDLAGNPNGDLLLAGKMNLKPKGPAEQKLPAHLSKAEQRLWKIGAEVFARDAHCSTCHGPDGVGAIPNIYPPLVDSPWVTGDEERLIKLTLHGLWGPLELKGVTYDPAKGVPPMTAFGSLLKDEEIAGVLTYVRNAWGNMAPAVQPETVKQVRKATSDRGPGMFFKPEDLLEAHPIER